MNVRIVALQGSDEFNVSVEGVQHQERIRPDHCWIVDHKLEEALMSSPISGFVERYDDDATLLEITLLCGVLQDKVLATAIQGRAMLSTR
jgi:hypothetical protein